MIAVDTQLLVYAHRSDALSHVIALRRITEVAESNRPWAIPWPCVHEFLGTVSRPRLYSPPSTVEAALASIVALSRSPGLVFLAEGADHLLRLGELLTRGQVVGPKVHDARIAAICLSHGVSELWTADRDFSRFPALAGGATRW